MKNLRLKNKPDIKKGLLLLLTVIFLSLCFTIQSFAQIKTGETAPDFVLNDLNGKEYQLSQFRNQQDYVVLCFLKGDDSNSIGKMDDIISFFRECNPGSSYQIIGVIAPPEDGNEEFLDSFNKYQDIEGFPLAILVEEGTEVLESYDVEGFPNVILLRYDLSIAKIYSRFNTREERSFYQYLNFIMHCSTNSSKNGSGCNGGVCPPPPGFE
ncbi:MAG: redoxin domain-containing protein [Atribacterota bacterium]|nr:redoxin domain-containing protein [Atribacterota bacterium]